MVFSMNAPIDALDEGERACRRIAAVSSLMMSCGEDDVPPAKDLHELARLVYDESKTVRRSLRLIADTEITSE